VITGLGALTPLGNDVRSSWQNLIAGRSSGGPIAAFDAADQTVRFACELKGFEPSEWIEQKRARRMDRFVQIVVAAARQAEADAGLEIARESDRIGVSIGTGMGGLKSLAGVCETLVERGPDRLRPFRRRARRRGVLEARRPTGVTTQGAARARRARLPAGRAAHVRWRRRLVTGQYIEEAFALVSGSRAFVLRFGAGVKRFPEREPIFLAGARSFRPR
jgi:hypothetical protein